MELLKNYHVNKGFTLIEVIVVIALIGIVFSFSSVGVDSYRRQILETETTKLAGLLQTARNRSMNNVNQSAYGVRITADQFILFHGVVDEPVPRSTAVVVSGLNQIVFDQLSGNTSNTGTITLSMDANSKNINIGANGRINW
ncbi:MAG: prepilin-type N-terminal cleavage/methylation domain-containing protein [Patescibacteria group bacterium]